MLQQQERFVLDDSLLIQGVLSGEPQRYGELVQRHWGLAVGLAQAAIGDSAAAEDIAQDSFLRAYQHLPTLRDPSRFVGWLTRIVEQNCVDHLRRRRRQKLACVPDLGDLPPREAHPPADHLALESERQRLVREAIARLPEKYRPVIVLRFVAGLTADEIARQLGQRPGTARVWLHRAIGFLRRDLACLNEVAKP